MEASEQRNEPAWMPSGLDADALREKLRGLKDLKLGDSPAEVAASLRQNLQGLKERSFGSSATPGELGSGGSAGATVQTPPFEERPELYVGAAFAGGFALAGVLRLLGR
jgi:hypothetical protein